MNSNTYGSLATIAVFYGICLLIGMCCAFGRIINNETNSPDDRKLDAFWMLCCFAQLIWVIYTFTQMPAFKELCL